MSLQTIDFRVSDDGSLTTEWEQSLKIEPTEIMQVNVNNRDM